MDGGKRIERWGAFVFSGPFGLRESISTVHGVPENTDVVFWGHGVDGNGDAVCTCYILITRDGTGSHFVTQRPSDPGIQRPGDPVYPVTLFYNELQMSTYV